MYDNNDQELLTPAGMHTGISAVMYAELGETTSKLINAMFEREAQEFGAALRALTENIYLEKSLEEEG